MVRSLKSKQAAFDKLCREVRNCNQCASMVERYPVLSKNNGNINSKLLFIAEAPGRLGADKFQIPLYGDASGKNFDQYLLFAQLNRAEIFITNCVLCNPRDSDGNNRTPSKEELKNCLPFLNETINIIRPQILVTLGQRALESINQITSFNIRLKEAVGELIKIDESLKLYPLYHPSSRTQYQRAKYIQQKDYEFLAEIYHGTK